MAKLVDVGSISSYFESLSDPRHTRNRKHLLGDIAVINLVRSDFIPELSLTLDEPVPGGQLIVNLRAEADPETMRAAVCDAIAVIGQSAPGLRAHLDHIEFFRPGKPQPTHRDVAMI